jgi:phosphatidylinositol glycan class B
MALMIAGLGLWILVFSKRRFTESAFILIGFTLAFLLGAYADYMFYGESVFPAFNYFEQNLLQDKVSSFGVHPIWWYISDIFLRAFPPFSLLLIGGFVYFMIKYPKSPITWSMIPFLLVHFLIGHKEERFLYPLIYLLPLVLTKAYLALPLRFRSDGWAKVSTMGASIFLWFNALVLLVVLSKPPEDSIGLYKHVYHVHRHIDTLYYVKDEPISGASIPVFYYKHRNLEKVNLTDTVGLTLPEEFICFFLADREAQAYFTGYRGEIIFSSFPDWIYSFNFNNWLDRSKPEYLYKFTKEGLPENNK